MQVEGRHELWGGMTEPYKHTIRAFLVHFHSAILRHSSERFNFRNGSVGAYKHVCTPSQLAQPISFLFSGAWHNMKLY